MTGSLRLSQILLACASLASAQYGYGGNPFNGGYYGPGSNSFAAFTSEKRSIVIAHAVLASLAFVIFFPIGAIVMRLGSGKHLWLVHAAIQAFAFILFIAAFGIGVYISSHTGVTNQAHPIIGIILFILLIFQPILGLLHHFMFKKHSKRTVWSYGHIWLGRAGITLGIINGGLGLQLAQRLRIFAPSTGAIIAYSVVAGVMWLLYVACAIVGEVKRRKSRQGPATYKDTNETRNGVGEHYKEAHTAPRYT